MLNYIVSKHCATLFVDGKVHSFQNDGSKKWDALIEAIKALDLEAVRKMIDKATALINYTTGTPFSIKDNVAYYHDEVLDTSLTRRMVKMMEEDFDITPMVRFINNLMENPSSRAVQELYDFLEACDLPITEDGCFIAYKKIRHNYTDCHSGTVDNHPGNVVTMPRNRVDDNKERTCSYGLHVCSVGYLKDFGGQRLILCKINPRDVVSIPTDYENSKMRVCRYEVLQELPLDNVQEFNERLPAVYETSPPPYDIDDEDDGYND